MLKRIQPVFDLFARTIEKWSADHMQQFAAALAYYTLFSIAPLLIIATAIAGVILGQDSARQQVFAQIRDWIGADGADLIISLIDNLNRPGAGLLATILGTVTLLLGAAGIFGQVKLTLLIIWEVKPQPAPNTFRAILFSLREQLLAVLMVLATGLALLGSVVVSTIFAAVNATVTTTISTTTNSDFSFVGEFLNIVVSVLVIAVIFAAVYKFVPGIPIKWRDVLPAGLLTAILFVIGRGLIGQYLVRGTQTSAYGAAGALVVVLLWIYYSALIFFLGAEFSQIYTYRFGSRKHKQEPQTVDLVSKMVEGSATAEGEVENQSVATPQS